MVKGPSTASVKVRAVGIWLVSVICRLWLGWLPGWVLHTPNFTNGSLSFLPDGLRLSTCSTGSMGVMWVRSTRHARDTVPAGPAPPKSSVASVAAVAAVTALGPPSTPDGAALAALDARRDAVAVAAPAVPTVAWEGSSSTVTELSPGPRPGALPSANTHVASATNRA